MDLSANLREVGRVTWGGPDFPRSAILRADGTWATPHQPELAASLDAIYRDSYLETGPAGGFPGARELHAWAARVSGTVTLARRPPDPPDVAY